MPSRPEAGLRLPLLLAIVRLGSSSEGRGEALTWITNASMSTGRFLHTAALLTNNRALVAGGWGTASQPSSAELYVPTHGTWTATLAMSASRYRHSATLLPNGTVLVAGGYIRFARGSAEIYDPTAEAWAAASPLRGARHSHTATLPPDGRVLVEGGFGGNGILSSVESYVELAPIMLTHPTKPPGGAFQFMFTNTPGARFTAAATTNVFLPLNQWTLLGEPGAVSEPSPGQLQFTDPKGTYFPPRFYNVRLN